MLRTLKYIDVLSLSRRWLQNEYEVAPPRPVSSDYAIAQVFVLQMTSNFASLMVVETELTSPWLQSAEHKVSQYFRALRGWCRLLAANNHVPFHHFLLVLLPLLITL